MTTALACYSYVPPFRPCGPVSNDGVCFHPGSVWSSCDSVCLSSSCSTTTRNSTIDVLFHSDAQPGECSLGTTSSSPAMRPTRLHSHYKTTASSTIGTSAVARRSLRNRRLQRRRVLSPRPLRLLRTSKSPCRRNRTAPAPPAASCDDTPSNLRHRYHIFLMLSANILPIQLSPFEDNKPEDTSDIQMVLPEPVVIVSALFLRTALCKRLFLVHLCNL